MSKEETERFEVKVRLKKLDIQKYEKMAKFADKLSWATIAIGTVIMLGIVIYQNWR